MESWRRTSAGYGSYRRPARWTHLAVVVRLRVHSDAEGWNVHSPFDSASVNAKQILHATAFAADQLQNVSDSAAGTPVLKMKKPHRIDRQLGERCCGPDCEDAALHEGRVLVPRNEGLQEVLGPTWVSHLLDEAEQAQRRCTGEGLVSMCCEFGNIAYRMEVRRTDIAMESTTRNLTRKD